MRWPSAANRSASGRTSSRIGCSRSGVTRGEGSGVAGGALRVDRRPTRVTTGRPHLAGEGALIQEPAVVEKVGALDAARAFVGERAHVLDPGLGGGEGGLGRGVGRKRGERGGNRRQPLPGARGCARTSAARRCSPPAIPETAALAARPPPRPRTMACLRRRRWATAAETDRLERQRIGTSSWLAVVPAGRPSAELSCAPEPTSHAEVPFGA